MPALVAEYKQHVLKLMVFRRIPEQSDSGRWATRLWPARGEQVRTLENEAEIIRVLMVRKKISPATQ